MKEAPTRVGAERVEALLRERIEANAQFFTAEAQRLATLCHKMAERFAREGRLVAFGASPADRSDARHVAVEFVHPVIVGKRALPALGLAGEGGQIAPQVALEAEAEDIAMAFGHEPDILAALAAARERGCLTIAFTPDSGAEWEFDLGVIADPLIRQEVAETLYHTLWEHVHIFLDQRGLLEGRAARPVHDSGASSFLYPFLGQQETDLDAILADVRQSILLKAEEISALRTPDADRVRRRARDRGEPCCASASTPAGGSIALGNGGSATDAMDVVADFRTPMFGGPPRRALDLTEDTGIITAVANDIGTDAIFLRQVIAYGREGDVLLALSTSGNSLSILAALREGRKRKMVTMAFVGYDGGNVAANGLADHVFVSRSENIPRIQEAHASGYHVLRELVELCAPAPAP